MTHYAENIFSYIRQQQIKLSGFCYFVTDDEGIIESIGGEAIHYAGRKVEIDEKISDVFPLLTGCLPLKKSSLVMPHIEFKPDNFADIHIYRQSERIHILFVDSTEKVSNLLQTIQRHNDRVLLNEKSDLYHNSVIATEIMNVFDLAVFEQVDGSSFRLLFEPPDWFKRITDNAIVSLTQIELIETFPFLELFVTNAEKFWKAPDSKRFSSELWTEMDSWGREYFLRAYAGKLLNANILIIAPADVYIEEKQDMIQKAREKSLDFERLEKAESALQKLLKFKERFVSIVSHDLRGPLSNMAFHSDFILKKLDIKDEKITKFLEAINKELNRVIEYNDKIYHWSNLELGNFTINKQEIKLLQLFNDIKSSFENKSNEKHISILIQSENNHSIKADEALFVQVLNNLISNSIKFTPNFGKIVIKSEKSGNNVLIRVIDTGVGMKQETISELFKEFNPAHEDGTKGEKGSGLGLGIAKRILDAHNFSVKVDSIVDHGTTFTLTIPV